MTSMREHGLMNPIVVNRKNELIAGHRRLESARRMGWEYIEATVLESAGELSMLELEIEENVLRRDFSHEELTEGLKRLEQLRNPGFFRRLWLWIRNFFMNLLGA